MTVLDRRPERRDATDSDDLARLLRRAAAGDAAAFMRFYDATIDVVHLYARASCAAPAERDDVVRSVYDRAWRLAAHHAGSGLSPRAWLLAGARRRPSSTAC